MQWFEHLQKIAALLSRMYLTMVVCLATWALLPMAVGWTPTIVMSGSMLPNVEIGDVVVAQPLTLEQKKEMVMPGHVLLYTDPSKPERLVTHRVVNVIKETGFITKGDANAKADPEIIPMSNVHGIERLRIPMIGIPIQASRFGDFTPMIIFSIATILAQILVRGGRERETPKKVASQPAPSKNRGRHRAKSSKGKPVLRFAGVMLTSASMVIFSLFVASSAASFSGHTDNNENNFNAMTDFTQAYKTNILDASPSAYYRLNEISGTSAIDSSGNAEHATYSPVGVTYKVEGALGRDTANKAIAIDGIQGMITSSASTIGSKITAQIWFKTSGSNGGKLLAFAETPDATSADRFLYMTPEGRIAFGIDTATEKTIKTTNSYNDGTWHMATVTLSGSDASLYIDGEEAASGSSTNAPSSSSGYWLIGGGSFTNWGDIPSFAGSLDEAAFYPKVLTPELILSQFGAA